MFQPIRQRLLRLYLAIIVAILVVFVIAVRLAFARSLQHQLIERLITLGQSAAMGAEHDHGIFKPDDDVNVQSLINHNQALQWFDLQGRLFAQQGQTVLNVPLAIRQSTQTQTENPRLLGVVVPIRDSDINQIIGYVRVSESLAEFDQTLRNLDLGLGGGIVIALVLGGFGSSWLTRQAMRPIEQSFQRLQQFTADASHELRSPLMAIKSNAAVALKYPDGMRGADAEKFMAIASATSQMTRLTEDLLFLARNDQMPPRLWKWVNITTLLTHLVQLHQSQAIANSLQLKAKLKEDCQVMGEVTQLTRLFTNLIDNALHYTPAEGTIEIELARIPSYLEVNIRDTGIGISSEHLHHLFDRFWRADQSRSQWAVGAGLGLAIAQSIAESHGGKISVTSQLEVGSCFTVRLPTTP